MKSLILPFLFGILLGLFAVAVMAGFGLYHYGAKVTDYTDGFKAGVTHRRDLFIHWDDTKEQKNTRSAQKIMEMRGKSSGWHRGTRDGEACVMTAISQYMADAKIINPLRNKVDDLKFTKQLAEMAPKAAKHCLGYYWPQQP